MNNNIYLDNAATTPIAENVLEVMLPYLTTHYGNPSAKYYSIGRTARIAVLKARKQVASLIGANIPEDEGRRSEIVFTSCATESNNTVLKTVCELTGKRHIITSAIEHHAIMETVEYLEKKGEIELTILPVDSGGTVSPEELRKVIRKDETALVSVMLANNEIGTIQPVKELAAIAHENGALFHTDAVQAAGKIIIDVKELNVDFLSLSAHKFYGPKGVGILYIKKGTNMIPLLHGGAQESHQRAGTLNVAGIVGMGAAAELVSESMEKESQKLYILVEKLWKNLERDIPQIYRNGDPENRLPNILNVRFAGAEGEAILMRLDMFGVQVSSGSACSTDSIAPSHVLMALGIAQEDVHGSIRISMGRYTTEEDIDRLSEILPDQIDIIRQMSVTWNE